MTYQIRVTPGASEEGNAAVESFVRSHATHPLYYSARWARFIAATSNVTVVLMTVSDISGNISELLPLSVVNLPRPYRFAVSIAGANCGGFIGTDESAKRVLLDELTRFCVRDSLRYVELRHDREHGLPLQRSQDKATFRVYFGNIQWADLSQSPLTPEKKRLIRQALRQGLVFRWGGREDLDSLYRLYLKAAGRLGIPNRSKTFFETLQAMFPSEVRCAMVENRDRLLAGAVVIKTGTGWDVPLIFGESDEILLRLRPNDFLYWKLLCLAQQDRATFVDFGRSTVGSGVYRFKKYFANPTPLFYQMVTSRRTGAGSFVMASNHPKVVLASRIWTKLPRIVREISGPALARYLV